MKILFLIVAVTAAAQQNNSSINDGHSLLSKLLKVTGFSDTCIIGAIHQCSVPHDNDNVTILIEEVRGMVQQASLVLKTWVSPPRHCKDLLDSGDSGSGLRQIYPDPARPNYHITVFCNNKIPDNEGWTVIQRRTNDTIRRNFYRTWQEYKDGFGAPEGEVWLGLDHLHALTSTTLFELRVDLEDYEGTHRWAKYGLFHVGGPDTNYRLNVTRYSGDAGDAMAKHNGQEFSTHDADHDTASNNCAEVRRGGWWYNACYDANLNGYQRVGEYTEDYDGISWRQWRGVKYSLRRASMMIRPA